MNASENKSCIYLNLHDIMLLIWHIWFPFHQSPYYAEKSRNKISSYCNNTFNQTPYERWLKAHTEILQIINSILPRNRRNYIVVS